MKCYKKIIGTFVASTALVTPALLNKCKPLGHEIVYNFRKNNYINKDSFVLEALSNKKIPNYFGHKLEKFELEKKVQLEKVEAEKKLRKTQDSIQKVRITNYINSDTFQDFLAKEARKEKAFLKNNRNYIAIASHKKIIDSEILDKSIKDIKSEFENPNQAPYIVRKEENINEMEVHRVAPIPRTKYLYDIKVEITRPYKDIKTFYSIEEKDGKNFLICKFYGKKNNNIIDEGYIIPSCERDY